MSVSTIGYAKGKIRYQEILDFIRQKYDKTATAKIETTSQKLSSITWDYEKFNSDDSTWDITSGFISFEFNGTKRMLFYMYDNLKHMESVEDFEENGNADLAHANKTYFSMGQDNDAIKILTDIISQYGGWIDTNDCDDISFIKITKNPDENIKPVVFVTMEDIYEKFGGYVYIIDK